MDSGLGRCLLPRPDLPLLGEDGNSLVTGGTADAFPVFGCVVEPAFADTFRAATEAAAALFAARFPSGAVESLPCCASEVAPEAEAVFFLNSSFLDAGPHPYSEVCSFGSPLCPVG